MRICLDVSSALLQSAGIGRYARELTNALQQLPHAPQLSLFHNQAPLDRMPQSWQKLARSVVPLNNKVWRLFLLAGLPLPRRWRQTIDASDLFHALDHVVPVHSKPAVMTVHDLTTLRFPQFHTRFNRWYQRISLPIMLKRVSAIIAVSQSTKRDLQALMRVPPDKITVVPLGLDHARFTARPKVEAQQRVLDQLNVRSPFIVGLGTLEPRKNLLGLMKAFQPLKDRPEQLVLVGAPGWGPTSATSLVQSLGLEDRVKLTGFVPDALLPDLYAAAEFFVYPSFYEGFGLPILEAMACGAAVITSDTSSLPEAAGDAALFVSPTATDELTAAMRRLLETPALAQTMRLKGLERVRQFSWAQTAQATFEVYQSVLGATATRRN